MSKGQLQYDRWGATHTSLHEWAALKPMAMATKPKKPSTFDSRLMVQYEGAFQSILDCGGDYVKLMPQSHPNNDVLFTVPKPSTCVVCGHAKSHLRKNVIPHKCKRYFPLVMKSKAKHSAMAAKLNKPFTFDSHEDAEQRH